MGYMLSVFVVAKKYRAMRLDHGTFSWGSESISRKCRIIDVNYNASDNDLVRTKKLVKNAIISVEAAPFATWNKSYYGVAIGKKNGVEAAKKRRRRQKGRELEQNVADQFKQGRLFACISSRPGQSGRCDGYIIEGDELAFYKRKMAKKK